MTVLHIRDTVPAGQLRSDLISTQHDRLCPESVESEVTGGGAADATEGLTAGSEKDSEPCCRKFDGGMECGGGDGARTPSPDPAERRPRARRAVPPRSAAVRVGEVSQ